MPIESKEDKNKFIEKINKTSSYTEIINKEKRKQLNTLTCKPKLIDKFCYLAEKRKWSKTTLMNEILEDYFDGLENNNYEDD